MDSISSGPEYLHVVACLSHLTSQDICVLGSPGPGAQVLVSLGPRILGSLGPQVPVLGSPGPGVPGSQGPGVPGPWPLGLGSTGPQVPEFCWSSVAGSLGPWSAEYSVPDSRYILCYILHIHFCITLSLQVYSLLLLIFVSTFEFIFQLAS